MYTEIQRIVSMLKVVNHTTPWHGTSIKDILDDINSKEASAKVIEEGNSIWEIIEHLISWRKFVIKNLSSGKVFHIELNTTDDWPIVDDTSNENWEKTIERFNESTGLLMSAMLKLKDVILPEVLPERKYSYYALLHGIIQHDIYHSGQISLLKKIIRSKQLKAIDV